MTGLAFPALLILVLFVVHLIRKERAKQMNEEEIQHLRDERRRLLEEREERTDLTEFDENGFWEIVEDIATRSDNNYRTHIILMRNHFSKWELTELVRLDNLVYRLFFENISYDLSAAASIIFKTQDIHATFLLMNIMMARGEVFFKQAARDPRLLIDKEFRSIEALTYSDVISDIYFERAKKFIPLYPEEKAQVQIKGEPWKEKDLPSRFPELWNAFA